MVALANPLDYHTYIWRDQEKMTQAWSGMTGEDIAMTFSIVDYPKTDGTDWACATGAALGVHERTGAPFAVVATLPELMPENVALELMAGGVVPMAGLSEALAAVDAAARDTAPDLQPVVLPGQAEADTLLTEGEAKSALAAHDVEVPAFRIADGPEDAHLKARELQAPLVLKGLGLAHKSEHGAVRLGLGVYEIATEAAEIGTDSFLIEEMADGAVAELLIGVTRDPAHGYVLTMGAGGVLTELLQDTVSMLVPSSEVQVTEALTRLKCWPLLQGYRGKPAADLDAVLRAVMGVQAYVIANADTVSEVEINPLLCTPDRAVAVDALIRKAKT